MAKPRKKVIDWTRKRGKSDSFPVFPPRYTDTSWSERWEQGTGVEVPYAVWADASKTYDTAGNMPPRKRSRTYRAKGEVHQP